MTARTRDFHGEMSRCLERGKIVGKNTIKYEKNASERRTMGTSNELEIVTR